jgi:hypothetical protein
MRNIILFGATAAFLSLGAVDAYAMGGGNLAPEESPYAILAPQTLGPSWGNEGRSVYTGPDAGNGAPTGYDAPATDSGVRHKHHQHRQY